MFSQEVQAIRNRATVITEASHTFAAKFQSECAFSGNIIWPGACVRMVKLAGADKAVCVLNTAYGVVTRNGFYEATQEDGSTVKVWTGRLFTSQVTVEEVLATLEANPGVCFQVFSGENLGDRDAQPASWRFDTATQKFLRSGLGGSAKKTRKQAAVAILTTKFFACQFEKSYR